MNEPQNIELKLKDVSAMIEDFKAKHGLSWIESTLEVCERENIEFEVLKKSLSKNLKEKIEAEASSLRLLKYKHKTVLD